MMRINFAAFKEHLRVYKLCYLFLIFLLLLIVRRPNQFTHPFIWSEDGTHILSSYIDKGFSSLLIPVNGYLIFTSKIINFIAFKASFSHYPLIASLLANLFIILVLLAIVKSPTSLKNRAFIALAILFIPTDSEAFGVALYSFWWAGLLGLLCCLWDKNNKFYSFRILFTFLSFSSSPFSIFFLPILFLRCFLYKSIKEYFITTFSIVLTLVQMSFILKYPNAIGSAMKFLIPNQASLDHIVRSYFGLYLFDEKNTIAFLMALFLLAFIAYLAYSKKTFENISILCLLFMSIFSTYLRLGDVFYVTHPYVAGPRYYFYPYILINIFLIHNFQFRHFKIQVKKILFDRFTLKAAKIGLKNFIIIVFVTISVSHSAGKLTRAHEYISWQNAVKECISANGEYEFPVFYDGKVYTNTGIKIASDDCRRLIEEQFFGDQGLINQ